MKSINKLLADTLTKSQHDNLYNILGVTSNMLTGMLNNIHRFERSHIRKIAELTQVPEHELVFDYQLGYGSFTGPQLDTIAREAGFSLGLIQEAA